MTKRPATLLPAPGRAAPSNGAAPPAPPDGLELTMADLGGEELAILSFPLGPQLSLEGLTDAERHVAGAIEAGLSNAQIAAVRGTSVRTVAKQVASLFRKLGVGSRRELASLGRIDDVLRKNGSSSGD